MNTQFHTPSFGDEEFDLSDVEPVQSVEVTSISRYNAFGNQSLAAEIQNTPTKVEMAEPVKPTSAYGLFFRDTVSAIKAQNPNTSFEDISKIVNSMWQVLDPTHKNVYNKKADLAKKEFIKQMTIYRSVQQSSTTADELCANNVDQGNIAQQPNNSPKPAQIASRPAVFTIARNSADSSTLQQEQQGLAAPNNTVFCNSVNTAVPQDSATTNQQPENVQPSNDTGSVLICIRENCNKRAIVNPDWEDEYCSNECVVIHCRNVFNQWVKSNMESQL